MSDTLPNLDPVTLVKSFSELAKENGQEDVFVLVCGPVNDVGMFNRCAYIDGDAVKVVSTLAAFINEKLPPHLQKRLLEIISQPSTQEPTNTPWVN